MKLSQALKQKTRLAGELSRLQNIFCRENSRRSDNNSQVDRGEVWNKIISTSDELGKLKGAISQANVPIYPKLERMAELKSRISYIENLPKREDTEILFVGRDQEKVVYTWNSHINQQVSDALTSEIQKQINILQDDVDNFNATTEVTV